MAKESQALPRKRTKELLSIGLSPSGQRSPIPMANPAIPVRPSLWYAKLANHATAACACDPARQPIRFHGGFASVAAFVVAAFVRMRVEGRDQRASSRILTN